MLALIAPALDIGNRVSPRPPKLSGEQLRLSRVNFFFDSGKAVRELGYPLLPFRGAVEKALAWYRANGYMPANIE
jgi:dihydroflavonol-4-reductase